jgi:hypothetical protein
MKVVSQPGMTPCRIAEALEPARPGVLHRIEMNPLGPLPFEGGVTRLSRRRGGRVTPVL